MRVWLGRQGHTVNRKRVQRLMRTSGLRAIYRQPRTSKPMPGNKVYPYLLGGMEITRPNHVWAADITYMPMTKGFLYLVAIIDWYSRYVVSWRLSNTSDADFCVEALKEALGKGTPEVSNTDQGSQFTGEAFTGLLEQKGGQNQPGREGTLQRRYLHRKAVAHGEVRRGVPESLLRRTGSQGWVRRLLPFLQQPKTPPGPGLPDPG